MTLPAGKGGTPDLAALLNELGRREWTNLLVEGGAQVLGAFFDADLVDEAHIFIAPKIIGGSQAKSPVGGLGCDKLMESAAWITEAIENIDGDAYVRSIRRAP